MKLNKYLFLTCLILLLTYAGILIRSVGVGNDFDYYFSGTLRNLISPALIWREFFGAEGLGGYTVSTLWSWPLVLLVAFLSTLGLEYSLIIKIFFLIPIIFLNFISIKRLTRFYGLSEWSQTIAILFYSLNTYILLLVDGGQLGLALAYGIFPLAFVSFKNYSKLPVLSNIITPVFYTLLLSIFDIRIVYLLVLLAFADACFRIFINKHPRVLFNYLKLGVLLAIFLIGVHAYWFLPSLSFRLPQLPQGYDRASQIDFLSFAGITHSLYLLQPHWYENVFGRIAPIRAEFVLIPILVFLAPILRKKDTNVAFWLLIALVSIFLTKGSSEPFANVYSWLFKNIPGFSLFRDPTKLFFLQALAYAVLLGISVGEIIKRLSNYPKVKFIFGIFCVSYILFLARPVWSGRMTGFFSEPVYKNEYFELSNILSKDLTFSRVIWIPKKPSLGFVSSKHPAIDGQQLIQKRPFAVGVKGAYETLNFFREAPYINDLLNISGVGYIGYPYLDPRKDDMHPDSIRYYYTFLNQLLKIPGISKVENSSIPLLKVSKHQDRFFIASNTWWIIGPDNVYNEATRSSKLSLSNNALIFTEESAGLGRRIDEFPEANIVLNNKTTLDLAATFIPLQEFIFPAKSLDFQPDKTGWWKREAADLINWRDFLQSKYGIDNTDFDLGGGWSVGEGSRELGIQNSKLRKGNILLARVMESSRSGSLRFYQEDKLIGEIATKSNKDVNIRWFEIGQLVDDSELTIVSIGDINVVNAIVSINSAEWQKYNNLANNLKNQGRIKEFKDFNTENSQAKVSYELINSTKYKIKVSNLTKPELLVFSENFDPLWSLEDKIPMSVYSLLNGFRVEENGEYIVEFKPQKYVLPGLFISGATWIILLLFYLLITRKKQNETN